MKEKYWIAFSSMEFIDSIFVQKLYNYFGDIEAAYNAPEKEFKNIEGLNISKTEEFIVERKKINPDKVFEEVEKRGINVVTFDDRRYPYMLSQIHNPPMVLYYKGDLFGCNLERTVAFVGSRRASANGRSNVRKIISDLKNTDICIVSGLAEGIDAVSHRSAIDNNLKTIGVIASGFDFRYPSSNRDLYEKLEHGCGAVVSEYYPTFEALKFRFPQRNRIVTGLSYGTVVGEAALRSGALISANYTLEQGRELMCMPGDINNKNTEGVYKLLKNGATMVTCGEDILNALNWEIRDKYQEGSKYQHGDTLSQNDLPPNNLPPNNLPPDNLPLPLPLPLSYLPLSYLPLYDILSIEPKGFDELQAETGMKTEELLTALTMMEVEGYIEQTEGDRYRKA